MPLIWAAIKGSIYLMQHQNEMVKKTPLDELSSVLSLVFSGISSWLRFPLSYKCGAYKEEGEKEEKKSHTIRVETLGNISSQNLLSFLS